jgi:hypothetical protein
LEARTSGMLLTTKVIPNLMVCRLQKQLITLLTKQD